MDYEKPQTVLLEEKKPESVMIFCDGCGQPNDIFNDVCVSCFKFFDEPTMLFCHFCGEQVDSSKYQDHLLKCETEMKKRSVKKQKCLYCKMLIDSTQYFEHQRKCMKEKQTAPMNLPPKSTADEKDQTIDKIPFQIQEELAPSELDKLTPIQLDAITYMHKSSIKYHYDVKEAFTNRMKGLGYGEDQMNILQQYIAQQAPVIIHVNFKKYMPYFLADTHYRNLFQTNKTSGSNDKKHRMTVQNRIFKNTYYNADHYQRVKYGVLNLKNDPIGVQCCQAYGKSYFVLKKQARSRCTFTNQDSFSTTIDKMGSLKHSFHVLNTLPDAELQDTMRAALGTPESTYKTPRYKEVQIHGPIQFTKDIQQICIDKSEIETDDENFEIILGFIQKHDIKYCFF